MKVFFLSFIIIAFISFAHGQDSEADSVKQLLEKAPRDTNRVELLLETAEIYFFSKPDSCLLFSEKALELARELHFIQGEVFALNEAGEALRFLGNYPRALKMQFEALQINREMKDPDGEAGSLGFIGFTYLEFREYKQALLYLLPASKLNHLVSNKVKETFDLTNIGYAYELIGLPDSALYYQELAYKKFSGLTYPIAPLKSLILTRLGSVYATIGKKDMALQLYHNALSNSLIYKDRAI